MLDKTLKETKIEEIFEEIFEVAKRTDKDETKLNALSTILLYAKDKEFHKKMLENFIETF